MSTEIRLAATESEKTEIVSEIFFDRNEEYFMQWLVGQGLGRLATDTEIIPVMARYLQDNNVLGITPAAAPPAQKAA